MGPYLHTAEATWYLFKCISDCCAKYEEESERERESQNQNHDRIILCTTTAPHPPQKQSLLIRFDREDKCVYGNEKWKLL